MPTHKQTVPIMPICEWCYVASTENALATKVGRWRRGQGDIPVRAVMPDAVVDTREVTDTTFKRPLV